MVTHPPATNHPVVVVAPKTDGLVGASMGVDGGLCHPPTSTHAWASCGTKAQRFFLGASPDPGFAQRSVCRHASAHITHHELRV